MAGFEDYQESKTIYLLLLKNGYNPDDYFYAIIQCLMRIADTDNLEKLKSVFPEEWTDLQARYNASGGKLEGET